MWVIRLPHAVLHTWKVLEGFKKCRAGSMCFLPGFFYMWHPVGMMGWLREEEPVRLCRRKIS